MKKYLIVVGVCILLAVVGVAYLVYQPTKTTLSCTYGVNGYTGECRTTCNYDSDCEQFLSRCVTKGQDLKLSPPQLSVAHGEVSCSCVAQVCVAKETGRIAI